MAKTVRDEVAEQVRQLAPTLGRAPGLAAVLVGDDPASHVYVTSKRKACAEAGLDSWLHQLPAHAGQNMRMTQVMKLLTIISTIFIPLTFVVGIYGMNFDHMPELHWRYGYFVVMGIMLAISVIMLMWFRRKRWL